MVFSIDHNVRWSGAPTVDAPKSAKARVDRITKIGDGDERVQHSALVWHLSDFPRRDGGSAVVVHASDRCDRLLNADYLEDGLVSPIPISDLDAPANRVVRKANGLGQMSLEDEPKIGDLPKFGGCCTQLSSELLIGDSADKGVEGRWHQVRPRLSGAPSTSDPMVSDFATAGGSRRRAAWKPLVREQLVSLRSARSSLASTPPFLLTSAPTRGD